MPTFVIVNKKTGTMENKQNEFAKKGNSRVLSGLVLLAAGIFLLAYKMGAPIPSWLFTWPIILIVIGLITGIKSNFHNPGSFILILIGSIFLIDQALPNFNFHNYIIPIILMGIGLIFIFRPRGERCGRRHFRNSNINEDTTHEYTETENGQVGADGEYIDIQAVFGGIKRNIHSKNFKGGEIISFMGGSEINFMQADIQHPVELEVNNVFGGTKLIIPGNWEVKNEISAIFGGVEDKRSFSNRVPDTGKKILLKGLCLFGGIEVTNY